MSGARVEIDDAEIRDTVRAVVLAGARKRALLKEIGGYLVTSTQRRFETRTGPDGSKWAPFAPKTLRGMPARRAPPQLLRDTNRLYASFSSDIVGPELLVGTNVVYAGRHQFGGDSIIPGREQTITFRTVNSGAGRKRVGGELVTYGSRLRFARASERAKRQFQKTVTIGEHSVSVPARPFLGISVVDRLEIMAICVDHHKRATGATGDA